MLKDETNYHCIGKLDFNASGLILLTNSPELQTVVQKVAQERFKFTYTIKVFGRFTEEKLQSIREGVLIKGKKRGPFVCNVKRYLNRNTIIKLGSNDPTMRDIKLIM